MRTSCNSNRAKELPGRNPAPGLCRFRLGRMYPRRIERWDHGKERSKSVEVSSGRRKRLNMREENESFKKSEKNYYFLYVAVRLIATETVLLSHGKSNFTTSI
jgi:hypothetical protein